MVILKIPIVYLCGVVYYAIKADAEARGRRGRHRPARRRTTGRGSAPPAAAGRAAAAARRARPLVCALAAHGRAPRAERR